MDNLVEFVGLGSLIGLSMLFALWLEWMALRVLLHLMPGRAGERRQDGQQAAQLAPQLATQLAPVKVRS